MMQTDVFFSLAQAAIELCEQQAPEKAIPIIREMVAQALREEEFEGRPTARCGACGVKNNRVLAEQTGCCWVCHAPVRIDAAASPERGARK